MLVKQFMYNYLTFFSAYIKLIQKLQVKFYIFAWNTFDYSTKVLTHLDKVLHTYLMSNKILKKDIYTYIQNKIS